MDLFTHVLAAGLVAEGIARAPRRALPDLPVPLMLGPVAFLLGGLSHLALDALPHFGFLPHLSVWTYLPNAWLVRPVVGGALAMAFVVAYGRGNRGLGAIASLGAVYPDVEKMAHYLWGMPWRLFDAHATAPSTYTAGISHRTLVVLEILLSAIFVVAFRTLVGRRLARSQAAPKT